MRLILSITSYYEQPAVDSQTRAFDTYPVTLGRDTSSSYHLSDISQHVSSRHAVITMIDGRLVIQDTSSNGLFLNDGTEPVGRGSTVELNHNDTLSIGDYTLHVAIERIAATNRESYNSSEQRAPARVTTPYDPFSRGPESSLTSTKSVDLNSSEDVWNVDGSAKDTVSWESHTKNKSATLTGTNASQDPATSDHAWADWSVAWPDHHKEQNDTAPSGGTAKQSDAEFSPTSAKIDSDGWMTDTDALSGLNTMTRHDSQSPDKRSKQQLVAAMQLPTGNLNESDVLPMNDIQTNGSNMASQDMADDQQKPSSSTLVGAPTKEQSNTSLDVLLRAASLNEAEFSHSEDAEILEKSGKLLLQMVDAMMALLRSRAEFKNFIHSDSTKLTKTDNNPLKFSLSASDALGKLLAHDTDGYLSPDKAIEEAVEDLKLHQLAMLESMEQSVKSVMVHFDPENLTKNLERSGKISANIPITRDAKLWNQFCEQYESIREEAVDDFGNLFGAEFRKSYEKSIKRKAGKQIPR